MVASSTKLSGLIQLVCSFFSIAQVGKLREAIRLCLLHSSITPNIPMSDFLDRLEKKGLSSRIKIPAQGEILSISYSLDGVAFAGLKIDRKETSSTL